MTDAEYEAARQKACEDLMIEFWQEMDRRLLGEDYVTDAEALRWAAKALLSGADEDTAAALLPPPKMVERPPFTGILGEEP